MASKNHLIKIAASNKLPTRQLHQSVNKCLRLHSLQRSEVKARADTGLLSITPRMECNIARGPLT